MKRILRSLRCATYLRTMLEILRRPARVRAPRPRAPRAAAAAGPAPARPEMRRPGYRPSAKWPKGCITRPPQSRGKLRFGAGPPLPD